MAAARCSILVVSEDGAADATATLKELARRMFLLVDPAADLWSDEKIRFEPPDRKLPTRGNLWKSERPQDSRDRLRLISYLGTKLLEGERSFVLYHIDGDRPWSEQADSENVRKFQRFIERDVRSVVEHRLRQSGAAERAPRLSQLLLIVPFHSIEAWLYQNIDRAIAACREGACGGAHVPLFEEWRQDRAALDEVADPAPKKRVCFAGTRNLELVRGLPVDELHAVEKSFFDSVNRLRACRPLCEALAETRRG